MEEIPAYKVIIAGTIVFIAGLAVFSVIFRAVMTFNELQAAVIQETNYTLDQTTMIIFGSIPWALGAFYVSLVGTVIYLLLKATKKPRPPPIY